MDAFRLFLHSSFRFLDPGRIGKLSKTVIKKLYLGTIWAHVFDITNRFFIKGEKGFPLFRP